MRKIELDSIVGETASAVDLARNFAKWQLAAMSGPVYITNHGRRTHVLASISDFASLTRSHARVPVAAAPANDDLVALADWIEEAVVVCDRELRIVSANRIAYAICRRPRQTLEGKLLIEALPELRDTLMEVHVRRTAVGGEPSAADLPSPFSLGAWVRMQCFPLGGRNVLIFRDITEEVQRHRLADVKETIIEAMSVHGGIGYIKLSMRGAIVRVDRAFCELLGLPEPRVIGLDICDLITIGHRSGFREVLEAVLGGQGSQRVSAGFLSNCGGVVRASMSIVGLRGAYAAEGAAMLITKDG